MYTTATSTPSPSPTPATGWWDRPNAGGVLAVAFIAVLVVATLATVLGNLARRSDG